MLVRMTVWSSKKVFLSRKEISSKNESSGVCDVSRCWRFVILSYAAFRAWNVRGLEDVSRCCKGLVLALRLGNILVWLRMFAARIVVPVWIWFAIEELGPRGRVNLSPKETSSYTVLCVVLAFRDFFRVYLRMFRIAIGALLRVFLTCRILRVKHSGLKVNRSIWNLVDFLTSGTFPLTVWLLGLSFVMTNLPYDSRFWVVR